MDIFSRKIVGWQGYEEESSALASELLRDLCHREGIQSKQLILHSDNVTDARDWVMGLVQGITTNIATAPSALSHQPNAMTA